MVVGICRIVLALPWNDSLKGKRSVVKSILERARGRFQVSASEVEDHDVHRRATLGFALVSNDARHVGSVLDKLVSFVAGATQAQLIDQSRSIEHYDLGLTGRGGDSWNPLEFRSRARGRASTWNDEDGDDEEED